MRCDPTLPACPTAFKVSKSRAVAYQTLSRQQRQIGLHHLLCRFSISAPATRARNLHERPLAADQNGHQRQDCGAGWHCHAQRQRDSPFGQRCVEKCVCLHFTHPPPPLHALLPVFPLNPSSIFLTTPDAIMDLESIKSPAMASFWQELAEMVPIGTIHVFAARLTCHGMKQSRWVESFNVSPSQSPLSLFLSLSLSHPLCHRRSRRAGIVAAHSGSVPAARVRQRRFELCPGRCGWRGARSGCHGGFQPASCGRAARHAH